MKKNIILTVLIFILLTPLFMWLWWFMKPTKTMNIFVLDKTVLNSKGQEHISLFWVLNHEKFIKKNHHKYNASKDYFGFFPDDKGGYVIKDLQHLSGIQLDSLSNVYDVAYYTDLYGIYTNEWNEAYRKVKMKSNERRKADRSRLIYGGLKRNDMAFLKLMKQKKKLIITEFNIIASPTTKTIRRKFEAEFGIKWTGWVGRYFDNLDTVVNKDIPRWLIDDYKKEHHNSWPFTRSGIAFVRNDEKVVILENKTQLNHDVPMIETPEKQAKKYNVKNKLSYPFWFNVVEAKAPNKIISSYHIDVNASGDSLMKANHIPTVFPAVIHNNNGYPFYYFAGDFCDNPIKMNSSYFQFMNAFSFLLYSNQEIDRREFFWKYYRPLTETIFDNYFQKLARQRK